MVGAKAAKEIADKVREEQDSIAAQKQIADYEKAILQAASRGFHMVAAGSLYKETRAALEHAGYKIISVDNDGGMASYDYEISWK